ncbi:hypothetical protein, partial [Pseudomonas aeruginosa]
LSFELGGKRTSLLAHQTPLSRRGFSPKSVSGISRPLHTEPSLLVRDEHLEEDMLKAFRLKSLDELEGAYFLVMGWLAGSERKPIINFGFAKYIAFVKYRVKHDEEA